MDKISLVNLLGVSVIAFLVPFTLGFVPRLRVPSIVLELLAGYVFGPAVLGWIGPGPVVTIISTIGVAFLLFLAGMEIDLGALRGAPLKLGRDRLRALVRDRCRAHAPPRAPPTSCSRRC